MSKQDKITFNHGKIVNISIVYALKSALNYNEDIAPERYLFGAVKLTKMLILLCINVLVMYWILWKRSFFTPCWWFSNNLIIFGVDMSSYVHVDNKKKHIIILGEGHSRIRWDNITRRKKCIQLILLQLKQYSV